MTSVSYENYVMGEENAKALAESMQLAEWMEHLQFLNLRGNGIRGQGKPNPKPKP